MKGKMWRKIGVWGISLSLLAGAMPVSTNARVCMQHGTVEGQTAATQRRKAAVEKKGTITLNGDDIRADNVNGLTYKGFGVLSANSTSDLLMDYKAQNPEAYAQLLTYLFGGKYPIMTHVKLEMGNDRDNSTGAEASTKRTKTEKANVLRNPGWQLAADAKKINPKVKVSILRWNAPKWVNSMEDVYQWYKESILAAYEQYGYMVDYINPNVNEGWNKKTDVDYTKKFAAWIAAEDEKSIPDEKARKLFHNIKLIVSDEAIRLSADIADTMKTDQDFYNAVDVVGYHYNTNDDKNDGMKWLADEQDKEVWNSEAQAVFSNSAFRPANNVKDPSVEGTGLGGTGSALEMGNTFIKGFVKSRRTHVVYQPAIGSFYEGGQFSFKELVSARDPWSGWIHYDAGLLVLAHLSKFAVTGWENEDNTAGIWRAVPEASKSTASGTNPVEGRKGGENYITLASPQKDNFSSVIVNDSEYAMSYQVKAENMNLPEESKLYLWETRAADEGSFNENYMKYQGEADREEDGSYTVKVKPYSVVTVTTLDMEKDEEHIRKLPVEGERSVLDTDSMGDTQDVTNNILYADDFDYKDKKTAVIGENGTLAGEEDYVASRGGDTGAMARYLHTINGAFESYKTADGNRVLRQQLDQEENGIGAAWQDGDAVALIGDFRWCNYAASVDVLFENAKDSSYGCVSIRQTGGSQHLEDSSGYTFRINASGEWKLYRKAKAVLSGKLSEKDGFHAGMSVWNTIKLQGAGDQISAYINGREVAQYHDKSPVTSGRIGLGSAYTHTQFDNLKVEKIAGYVPYYTELLDNMEMYDLSAQKNKKLIYDGKWSHANGQGMYVYQRSLSVTEEKGASVSYTFAGTGLELLAGTDKTAKLKVWVDGKEIPGEHETQTADNMNMIYRLDGLENAIHTVKVVLEEGRLSVDMVGVLGAPAKEQESPSPAVTSSVPENVTQSPTPAEASETPAASKPPVTANPAETPESRPMGDAAQASEKPASSDTAVSPGKVPSSSEMTSGRLIRNGGAVYRVISEKKRTAAFVRPCKKNEKVVVIPAGIKVKNKKKTISYKVTAIDKNAFQGCKKLKRITIHSKALQSIGKNAFSGVNKKAVFHCPSSCKKKYKKIFTKKTGYKKSTMKMKF